MEWIGTLILGIVVAYLQFNQHTKNVTTDHKLREREKKQKLNNSIRRGNSAKVYRELWELLHELECDRVYILQPHPTGNIEFLSVGQEVNRRGITEAKEVIHRVRMKDMAKFSGDLASRDWIIYCSTTDVIDKRARAYMQMLGTKKVIIRRLADRESKDGWKGNVFAEYTSDVKVNLDHVKKEMNECAENIQYILPEYEDE